MSAAWWLNQPVELHRFAAAADGNRGDLFGAVEAGAVEAGGGVDGLGEEDGGAELLVECFDAEGHVHHVADDGVFLALARADVADDGAAGVQRDADARGRNLAFGGEALDFG